MLGVLLRKRSFVHYRVVELHIIRKVVETVYDVI